MAALFQTVLMRLALCGLAASLVLLLLRSRLVRDAFARQLSAWRSLTVFGRFAVCSFLLIGILIGGDKTNNVPPNMNAPLPQMMAGGGSFQTGLTGLSGVWPHTPSYQNPVNLVNPVQTTLVQQTFAAKKAASWNVRGAWKDSFWLDFEDCWVLPWGANHLSGVEVVSYGQVWQTPFDTNVVASLGVPAEIVPGLSSFAYELTPSNSYRFVWTDAAIDRDTNDLVTAAIELFRNGDTCVTTNGILMYQPRELPFPHNGFGQDAEWVAANFTNAAEIAAAGGYAAWVDEQVGEGLTNGLYKLIVSVAEDPPETTLISAGDYSIAVTNAGEYVFLMEKGPAYDFCVSPGNANVTITAVDDVPTTRFGPALRTAAGVWEASGRWIGGYGEFGTAYNPGDESAMFWWLPSIIGTPDLASTGPDDDSVEFSAVLFDCANADGASFAWSTSDGLTAVSPYAQATEVESDSASAWDAAYVSVTAWLGSLPGVTSWLHVNVSTNPAPYAGVSLAMPSAMFANNDDDNGDGTVDYEGSVHFDQSDDDDVVCGSLSFISDVPTNGTIQLTVTGLTGDVYTNNNCNALIHGTVDIPAEGVTSLTVPLYFNPYSRSSYNVPLVTAEWLPDDGERSVCTAAFTVVEPVLETICSETKTASPQGASHVYTYNPCAVAVGDDAYFKIDVLPNAFPDSEIVWSSGSGGVEFIGGDTGREVHVRGTSVCDTILEVCIGGRTHNKPGFPLKVVEARTYKITAWIVSGQNGIMPIQISNVQDMISPLNDIYRQVGVSFYLDSVTVTNIPDAFNLLYESTTNDVWNFDRLVNIGHDTGGIECYFVNDFWHEDGRQNRIAAANCVSGMVLTAKANVPTLAHEIGHFFGLQDVYLMASEKDEDVQGSNAKDVSGDCVKYASCHLDWNGGCDGERTGGARYYPLGTTWSAIMPRLVMYGIQRDDDERRDITRGDVDGVSYVGSGSERIWYDVLALVGFFESGTEHPSHQ